jgi:Zn-dependent M28 family amino/carboxypeptidase
MEKPFMPLSKTRLRASLLLLFVLFTTLPGRAQNVARFTPQTIADMRRLQQAALDSDYAYRQAAYLCNNIGPRLSGSPQAARAVEYVASEMRKLGLDVKLEKVVVPRWVRGEERGALTDWPGMAPGTTQKIVLTALGGSVKTPAEGLTAEVLVVNNYDELNALGAEKVSGKIVLFNAKFDRAMAAQGYGGAAYGQAVQYRGGGPVAAAKLGAAASLNRSAGGSNNRVVHTGQTNYDPKVPAIPAAAVSSEDADLIAYLAAQGPVRMRLLLTPQTLPDVESYNVVADLKGSERPDEIVIVSGHLDSWDLGTGALDDAVGVAAAMQTANLFTQLKLKPKRTLRVVAWMNEENGFRGPNTYVKDHEKELDKHFAAIELDLGAGHPLGFIAGGKPELVAILAPVAEVLRSSGAGLSRTEPRAGSDIGVLGARGVPTFEPWVDQRTYFNYHHTPADTLDKVNPRELAENVAVMAVLAYGLANLNGPLPR